MSAEKVLIVGASARAAAFSAMRAGFQPWCADRFADVDLASRCTAHRVPAELYPEALEEIARCAPPGPWMFAGGLEHYPDLVDRIAMLRPLWGNPGGVLRLARAPEHLHDVLTRAGLPSPRLGNDSSNPASGWLVKPRRAHTGIRLWTGESIDDTHYLQERIEGESVAAVFLAGQESTELLGVTKQLVGEAWLHAPPYRYCGSLGPLDISSTITKSLATLGEALRTDLGLLGLFGVDCVLRGDTIWTLEVNPRYTASVEILEYATGRSFLADHAAVFRSRSEARTSGTGAVLTPERSFLGKAVLYARDSITVPVTGPWTAYWQPSIDLMPHFADIPHPGERIEAGEPVLTFFDRGPECLARLKKLANLLDCALTKVAT